MGLSPNSGSYSYNSLPFLEDYVGSGALVDVFLDMCMEYEGVATVSESGEIDISTLVYYSGNPPQWDDVSVIISENQLPPNGSRKFKDIAFFLINGGMSKIPFYDTFVDGRYTIMIGDAAESYYRNELMQQSDTSSLPTPLLYFVGGDAVPIGADAEADQGYNYVTTDVFVATFNTRYGQSGPSNAVTVMTGGWNSISLEVVGDNIPSYVTDVYYYRNFGGTFFRVAEVSVT